MELSVRRVDWEFIAPFRVAYRMRTHAQTVVAEIRDGKLVGRGEGLAISYRGETVESMLDQLAAVAGEVRNGISRSELLQAMAPGGARNALDCALWDIEAKRSGRRVWELVQLPPMLPLVTTFTLGLDTCEAATRYSVLKIKLDGKHDRERVSRVRAARPDADIIVDANQAWDESLLRELVPQLVELDVKVIEQPMAPGKDDALRDFSSPIPLCADESFQTAASLRDVMGKYQMVNIKLDKTGGLTEALHAARLAAERGLRLMVGCMGGSSLAMAPAFVAGQLGELVDLDGPLLLKSDVAHPIRYEGSRMFAPDAELWG
jgi:L-alanine-DL-glutamate epimerase-like enolase superfamily enzyme